MNLKQAKRLRCRALRVFTEQDVRATLRRSLHPNIRGTEYERHKLRGIVRVAPTCPRGVYLSFKRVVREVRRRVS